jgi:hypothetical protein
MSDKDPQDAPADIREQLELLLKQQHEALLHDDMEEAEKRYQEIMNIAAGLSEAGKRFSGPDLERISAIHDRMVSLLLAKKELVGAEIAAIRQRRSLNKSYRVHDE